MKVPQIEKNNIPEQTGERRRKRKRIYERRERKKKRYLKGIMNQQRQRNQMNPS